MNVPSRAGTMMDEAGSSIFPADDPVSTPPIPRWCNGSTPVFGTVRRGSNPRRGATPIPLRNAQSLFSFRSEGHTEFRGQSLASMDTVWRAVFRQRFFSPSVSRCAGTAQSGKGAASAFNRAERDAIGEYANRVGDGLQNRAWLGSTPAIASHRIRISGTDTCRRSCRASPSVKVHLTSESAELRTRVDGTDHKPTRRIRTDANPPRVDARPSVRLPRTDTVEPECGQCIPTPSRRDSSDGRAAAS